MPIILFYKTDCKAGTTIKMPIILLYKTNCKAGTTIKMAIILFYKTECKVSTTTPIFHLVKLVVFRGGRRRQNFRPKGGRGADATGLKGFLPRERYVLCSKILAFF